MKHLLTIIFLLAAFISTAQNNPYKITTPNTFIYKNPGPPMQMVVQTKDGDTLNVLERTNDNFYKVSYNGQEGYVIKKNITEIINVPLNPETNQIDFTGVVHVPGVTKDQLYARAKEWFAVTFKSANYVLQMDDKTEGILIGKGNAIGSKEPNVKYSPSQRHSFTVKIYLKDGRFKYSISDIKIMEELYNTNNLSRPAAETPIERIIYDKNRKEYSRTTTAILQNSVGNVEAMLKAAMKKPISNEKDW